MKISETSKSLMIHASLVSLVILLAGAAFLRNINGILFFGLGVLIGTLLCFLRIVLLERSLTKSLDLAAADANLYARSQFLVRYVLTGVVLVGSAFISPLSLYGAALGLLSLQVAAYVARVKK